MSLGKRTRKYLKHRVKKSRFSRNKNNIKQGGNRRIKRTLNKSIKRTLNKTRKISGGTSNGSENEVNEGKGVNEVNEENDEEKQKVLCLIPKKVSNLLPTTYKRGDKLSIISFQVGAEYDMDNPAEIILTNDNELLQTAKVASSGKQAGPNEVLDIRIITNKKNPNGKFIFISLEFFYSWRKEYARTDWFRRGKGKKMVVDNCSFNTEFIGKKEDYDILMPNYDNNDSESSNDIDIKKYKLILYILTNYHIEHASDPRIADKIKKFIDEYELIKGLKDKIALLQEKNEIEVQSVADALKVKQDDAQKVIAAQARRRAAVKLQQLMAERERAEAPAAAAAEASGDRGGGSKKRKRTRKRARRRR